MSYYRYVRVVMTSVIDFAIVIISAFLILSILASIASTRLSVPSLLLFLVIGMLAGSDGLGGIYFDDPHLAQTIGVVALVFILFDGGISTNWISVRPTLSKAAWLSTVGVFLTALLLGLFASKVLGISFLEGMLLGSIVSSTDAAAVFSILRSKSVSLKGSLAPLLELESGSNDPMAVFMTIGLIHLIQQPSASMFGLLPMFFMQMGLGTLMGYAAGRAMTWVINHIRLDYEGLYPVLTMALVLLTYGVTALLGGSGFLAVYIAALVLGNSDFLHKKSLIRFHDGIAWLMQIAMFLTLGLLVFPTQLLPIIPAALLISAFLMLVARPISVFVTLHFSKMTIPEKTLISWVGLRGAVPIILATFPLVTGLAESKTIFHVVFFIVILSVLLQGTTISLVARWLKLDAPFAKKQHLPLEFVPTGKSKNDLVEVPVPGNSPIVGKRIVELGLPKHVLVALIVRNEEFIVPRGDTEVEAGDVMLVLAEKGELDQFCSLVGTCQIA